MNARELRRAKAFLWHGSVHTALEILGDLQVRARVLNRQLRQDFERWHPQLKQSEEPHRLAAQHPEWTALQQAQRSFEGAFGIPDAVALREILDFLHSHTFRERLNKAFQSLKSSPKSKERCRIPRTNSVRVTGPRRICVREGRRRALCETTTRTTARLRNAPWQEVRSL